MKNMLIIVLLLWFLPFGLNAQTSASEIEQHIHASHTLVIDSSASLCTSTLMASSAQAVDLQVKSFFTALLDTNNWPARWQCGEWTPFHGWLYIGSDLLIWLAYFAIPAILAFFVYERKSTIPFKSIFILFIGFILACGLTHFIDAAIFWWPAYRLSAVIRFMTAVASLGTVFALIKVIPKALELKSPDVLENVIQERTRELVETNKKLENEILQRQKAEEEIIRLNKSLSEFQQAIHTSSIVSVTDRKGNITYVNENFEEISEYTKEELLGQNHRIINSGHHEKSFWINMWKTISQGQTWRGEVKNRTKSGNFYWVDTFIMPFLDEAGKVKEYLSIRNDITQRKKAELELKQLNEDLEEKVKEKTRYVEIVNEELYQMNQLMESLQKHIHIGVWQTDLAKKKSFWSEEVFAIHELPVQNSVSLEESINFYHPDHQEMLKKATEDAISKGIGYDLELKLITHEKKEVWVRAIGIPIMEDGKTIGLKGLFQNIDHAKKSEMEIARINTMLKARTEKLEVLNKELEGFSYSVSHDLRAPLRSIAGYAQILQEDYSQELDDEGNQTLQTIIRNAEKMGQLIDDLLEFSRLGRKDIEKRQVDINKLIEGVLQELKAQEREREINVTIHPLEEVAVDPQMIKQVWFNLIANALKYTRNTKVAEIEIGSNGTTQEICFYIRDNGVGFNMNYKDKLFNVFQRLHSAEEFEGTGVGLALVKRIIDRHGGKIWAEAKENEGATFYFTIPK